MSDLLRDLARFTPTDRDAWRADVERSLKGRAFEKTLIRRTHEGLSIEPLYTRADRPAGIDDEAPGLPSFARGLPDAASGAPRRGWTRAVEVDVADPHRANTAILADLDGGAERVILLGGTPADLDVRLAGVQWSLAPVSVVAPADPQSVAALADACERLRTTGGEGLSVQLDLMRLSWQADGPWLETCRGAILREGLRADAGLRHRSDGRPLYVSTTGLRHAGADMADEIAAALGLFVSAVRTLEPLGLSPAATLRAAEFRLGVGGDFFGEIAKLRAFRHCLWIVLDALGIAAHAHAALVTASTAGENLTVRDVHVNLLRTTAEATAAVLGGADGIVIAPFDARVDNGGALGRRLARNLHSLLAEESDVGTVIDPAGGSFYLEHRTDQLAEAAWQRFTALEASGGFVAACRDGRMAATLSERWQARTARLRSREEPILGVSVFARLDEEPPKNSGGARDASRGPSAPELHYLDEDFEALRARTDAVHAATGERPAVAAVLVGAPLSYAARLDWTADLLAAAGIRLSTRAAAVADDGAWSIEPGIEGEETVVIIAPDAAHETIVPGVASALRQAGVGSIVVAGRPGANETILRASGVTGFIHAGIDAIPFLQGLVARAEVSHVRS